MKNRALDLFVVLIGVLVLGTGLFLVKVFQESQGVLMALPYVCIGIGCGVFGHGMGNVLTHRAVKKDPALLKQIEIAQNDERNVAIGNRAKAKAYDIMTFVFGALMLSFALMGVELIAVLLLVSAYLFVQGCGIYYRCKYDREM